MPKIERKIDIINPEAFINAMEKLNCGKDFAVIDNKYFQIFPSKINPPAGYEAPINFPECCAFHKEVFKTANELFEKFPHCCDSHKLLEKEIWFNKKEYEGMPLQVVNGVSYTMHQLGKYLEKPDWYKEITDYIQYCIWSFGQFPEGYGSPLGLALYVDRLKHDINSRKEIPQEKKRRLVEFIDNGDPTESKQTDLNILLSTYKKWLKTFPFDISYFQGLKKHFEKTLPLLKEKPVENKYMGLAKAKLHTQEGLIKSLVNITKTVLGLISTRELLEQSLITDTNKHRLELLNESHKVKQVALVHEYSKSEIRYVKILKKWLVNEKQYFKEASALLKKGSHTVVKPVDSERESFFPIDEESGTFKKVPFEIRIIYSHPTIRTDRYVRVRGNEFDFFTEASTHQFFAEDLKTGELFTAELRPLTKENLSEYYKAYGDGFVTGYNDFDSKITKSTSIFKGDPQSVVRLVFDYINSSIPGLASYGSAHIGDKHIKTVKKDIWFDTGVKGGEKYKAWYFVINNYSYFIDLFRKHPTYIKYYQQAAEYWKNEPGGEGMYSHLQKLLSEIESNTKKTTLDLSKIPTDELEKCKRITGYWMNGEEEVVKELLSSHKELFETFVDSFAKELNANLLIKETKEGKTDLIKYYIFEFWELNGFFKHNEKTLYKSIKGNTITPREVDEVGSEYEKYVIVCNDLFDYLFYEIQVCCIKYNIDFFQICDELNFNLQYLDSGITMGFEDRKTEKKVDNPKLTIAAVAIMHIFISNFENGTPITKTNAKQIAAKYGFNSPTSGKQLKNEYDKYKTDSQRKRFSQENGRAFREHLQRYESILSILQQDYKKAFIAAKSEYDFLKAK